MPRLSNICASALTVSGTGAFAKFLEKASMVNSQFLRNFLGSNHSAGPSALNTLPLCAAKKELDNEIDIIYALSEQFFGVRRLLV